MTEKTTDNWFASWFDTKYYHLLYKDRNDSEAEMFMTHLTNFLNLPEQGSVLDLACGKGRHAKYLNSLGYNVTGVDLSKNSINTAKAYENDTLQFHVHDMRVPYAQKFDAVFNLFTSFGYFDDENDNIKALQAIQKSLNDTGFGVLDFMNVDYIIEHLVPEETKTVEHIDFHIKRFVKDGFIYKEIRFTDAGKSHFYTEKVQAITLNDFERYFEQAGINLLAIFGDYKLHTFYPNTSKRLILLFK
ncbi:MAG: class I SAM-dependent methyltransferase [Flavobacteriaceae bacterium]